MPFQICEKRTNLLKNVQKLIVFCGGGGGVERQNVLYKVYIFLKPSPRLFWHWWMGVWRGNMDFSVKLFGFLGDLNLDLSVKVFGFLGEICWIFWWNFIGFLGEMFEISVEIVMPFSLILLDFWVIFLDFSLSNATAWAPKGCEGRSRADPRVANLKSGPHRPLDFYYFILCHSFLSALMSSKLLARGFSLLTGFIQMVDCFSINLQS